jgi:hypothetical protein
MHDNHHLHHLHYCDDLNFDTGGNILHFASPNILHDTSPNIQHDTRSYHYGRELPRRV